MNLLRTLHNFEVPQSFQSGQTCCWCGLEIDKAHIVECSLCHQTFHDYCKSSVFSPCYCGPLFPMETPYYHNLIPTNEKGLCSVCRKMSGPLMKCTKCTLYFHEKCTLCSPPLCRQASLPVDFYTHYLVSTSRGRCSVCGKVIQPNQQSVGYHCIYCEDQFHSTCVSATLPISVLRCPRDKLGLSKYLVHPSDIRQDVVIQRESQTPLIFVVNENSGGSRAKRVSSLFEKYFSTSQFVLIQNIDFAANRFGNYINGSSISDKIDNNLVVIVCGGDGSIEASIDHFGPYQKYLILPYGTGNDLSRSLGFTPDEILDTIEENGLSALREVLKLPTEFVDRWVLQVSNYKFGKNEEFRDFRRFTNYLSVGMDGAVAQKFSESRSYGPSGPFLNKCRYALSSTALLDNYCLDIDTKVLLELDGEDVELPPMDCLVFMSSVTCYGGQRLLKSSEEAQKMDDGIIEIFYIKGSLEMGSVSVGMAKPTLLARAKDIVLTIKPNFVLPFQSDGEPFLLQNAVIHLYTESQILFFSERKKMTSD
ncbi:diacylglycerol kinase epsilon, putative [Entamoeba invadens IP1]|uniref:Diacylglycerol kinase n=1 Tax=Entamoeba invadens IP1 TaxID=370355 RepID=L7FM11_ENTIV|nr:diacylglycerol kinase epsilon, putative [Entamoeba invadens IP1]ELP88554.1 diacylglycerol kinase epsilon, putative [Entamoeba invadens IP1]|eukprot:XP_004255325.1 diacylglycerol kinase epsilon, putative [Entamoeba invadens IP1]